MQAGGFVLDEAHHIGRTQSIEPHLPVGNTLSEKAAGRTAYS